MAMQYYIHFEVLAVSKLVQIRLFHKFSLEIGDNKLKKSFIA